MPKKWTGNLVGLMHDSKISKTQLAKELGVTREYVSMVLNGHREPEDAKEKFAAALERIVERRNEEDAAAYRAWQQELAQKGVEPEVLLARYEAAGMTDYVKQVRAVIQRMEGSV